ncbi:MAG: hypothetical protein RLY95_7 [Pseudomonadota bacterium]|jgi:type IV secretion system protein VirB5
MSKESGQASSNPYLNAKREWDERYGDQISRAHSWRIAALASSAVSALAVLGAVYIGSQSKIQPMVVALDTLGSPLALALPSKAAPEKRILEAQIANWIWNARTVISDGAAQKELIARVYAMAGKDAAQFLNSEYAEHPPFGGQSTSVSITGILPISNDTFQVTWNEVTTKDGQAGLAQQWKANVTTGFDPKLTSTPKVILANPLGIFVRTLSWTQLISTK